MSNMSQYVHNFHWIPIIRAYIRAAGAPAPHTYKLVNLVTEILLQLRYSSQVCLVFLLEFEVFSDLGYWTSCYQVYTVSCKCFGFVIFFKFQHHF